MARLSSLVFTVFMMAMTLTTWAQENKTTPKAPSAGQVLSAHYARTYQLAIRYNDYDVAKTALYNLYVENPQNDSILFSLSALYLQSGQYASAVLSAKDVLQVRPDHTGAMEIAAVSFENLGLKDKALENYESLYLQTNQYEPLYKMAFLQYDLKRYSQSKTNIDILLEKPDGEEKTVVFETEGKEEKEFPIKVALLNLKGLIAKAQGDKSQAKKLFEEALKIAPEFPLAKENLKNLEK